MAVGALLALALAHAIWTAVTAKGDRTRSANIPGPAVWWLWGGLLVLAILLLPAAFQIEQHALASLIVFGSILAFPAAYVDSHRLQADTSLSYHIARLAYRLLPFVLALVALISSIIYLRAAWTSIGSVDFFYYICTARDMLAHGTEVSDHCYSYFPGVYAFWRTVMKLAGNALPQLQFAYLLLLVLNALLLAATVGRMTRNVLASCFSALWYLVLVSRFEGFAGVSEPLATAILMIGCLVWNGQPLRGRRGVFVAVLFGITLGMAVYAKQQAGLLTLGAISLVLLRPLMARERKHGWGQLALLPLVAATTLVTGLLLEGKGWVPLTEGLEFASEYGTESSLPWNLYVQIRGDESAAVVAGLMVLVWMGTLWKGNRRQWADSPSFQMASFAFFAFLFALAQFISRPFGHYMLLAIPFLILGSVLLAHAWLPRLPERLSQSLLVRTLLLTAVAALFFNTAGRANTLWVWRWHLPDNFHANALWHEQSRQAHDIAAAQAVVIPDSKMYILPPRHNSIYYLLRTRTASTDGYTFFETDSETFPWAGCRYFILLTHGLSEHDYQFSSAARLREMRHLLLSEGFHPRDGLGLQTMELFEKTPKSAPTGKQPNPSGRAHDENS